MSALIIHEPGRASRVFILRKAESLIGSGVLNDERLRCKGVEPHHLAVVARGEGYAAVDKGDKGMLVNGARVADAPLADGDEVRVGEARIRFDAAYTHDEAIVTKTDIGSTDVLLRPGDGDTKGMIGMLIFRGGERRIVELLTDPVYIGSDPGVTVPVPERFVSGRHASIYRQKGKFFIRDLSRNGTWVDTVKVVEAELHDCAVITIGKPQLVFRTKRAGQGRAEVAVFEGMVGNSAPMLEIYSTILKNAANALPVLITGETGTGKELVARALHRRSGRTGRCVALNCAAIPRELAESELFGHEKGAFTGAHEARAGAFEQADGGTLFLDEIGEMPLELQVKLLRAVQEGEVKRVGGNKTIIVKPRIVAATNRDLRAEVAAGKFREDLFYRLNVIPLALPPLRDRIEDVPSLADYMLDELSEGSTALTDKAREKLKAAYEWPGNIRELHNVLSFAMSDSKGGMIDARDLKIRPASLDDHVGRRKLSFPNMTMAGIKQAVVLDYMERFGGDKKKVAEMLDIGHTTVKDLLRPLEKPLAT